MWILMVMTMIKKLIKFVVIVNLLGILGAVIAGIISAMIAPTPQMWLLNITVPATTIMGLIMVYK